MMSKFKLLAHLCLGKLRNQEIGCVTKNVLHQMHLLVSRGVHEVVILAIVVQELHFLLVERSTLHLVFGAEAMLDRKDKFLLVDVREESEYAKDHLPGAIHLGKGIIERDIEERAPELNTPLVLYCGGGYRSALAADNLQKMGYTGVLSMDGGIRGWREKGFPLTKG